MNDIIDKIKIGDKTFALLGIEISTDGKFILPDMQLTTPNTDGLISHPRIYYLTETSEAELNNKINQLSYIQEGDLIIIDAASSTGGLTP